ncbi:bZIP transcription factor [Ruminiclostridium cellulolyticum]|uniref:Uncharacterized protein n=1 Tax=Ruminiclostridium cellulolyticum (strain ATCC 35319 / DSM 5812 / JCM 6584 / H10) TaxID=394503 RepID=B8I107_RUMCH|nr:bZIP transcription factor [Ruminiclostridium cellulolyticum]ACL77563.1 hypothetical protein Ccel_3274 [Ruminiclostridium cellulolyticum H10]
MEALRCAVLAQDGTTVENIVIADQSFAYANGLIVCGTVPVGIGDIYRDGFFYRNGVKLEAEQTAIEQLQAENAELRAKIEQVSNAVDCLLNMQGTT